MSPSVGKKLSLFVGVVVVAATGAIGYVSYNLMEAKYAEVLRKDTLDAATLLSSRIRNEMRHIAEKGRFLASAALEDFKNPDDQIRFLEDNLTIDEQLIGLSLHRRSGASDNKWIPVFRLTRPEEDATHLEEEDFKQLDLKYPLDFGLVSEGAIEITVGSLKDGTPILREAIPIVKKKGVGFTQLLEIEVRQEKLTAAFAESTAHFSFVVDRNGRLLTQTDPTHFTFGEDLNHLPILQMARSTEAPNGNLDYYELPGGVLQYGSYYKVGYADLIVVTQAPKTHVFSILKTYTRQALMMAAACVFLAMALSLLASWGIVGARLAKLAATLARIKDGKFNVSFPDTISEDEIGGFARRLQQIVNELRDRERVHGTHAKLRSRKVRAKLEEGKVPLTGERTKATVLACHLRGIEDAIKQADPSVILPILNRFHQTLSDTVESNDGIVDTMLGGAFIAYWGVPFPEKEDARSALATAIKVREAAKELNESLRKSNLPEVTLAVGMHHGTAITGQIGTEDRLEYRVVGEAMELALRLQTQTEQYGNDIILSGPLASQAPEGFDTQQIFDGDDKTPPLFELVGASTGASRVAKLIAEEEKQSKSENRTETETETESETEAGAAAAAPSPEPALPSDFSPADEPPPSIAAVAKKKKKKKKSAAEDAASDEAA